PGVCPHVVPRVRQSIHRQPASDGRRRASAVRDGHVPGSVPTSCQECANRSTGRRGPRSACGAPSQAAFEDEAPGPVVAHSCTSNQCVPASAAATSASVCCALNTWCSRSQQISTCPSDTCETFVSASNGSCASATVMCLNCSSGASSIRLGQSGHVL